jgi:intergrase/recombinase
MICDFSVTGYRNFAGYLQFSGIISRNTADYLQFILLVTENCRLFAILL